MTGVIPNAGLDALRDFVQSEVAELAVGTGTTEPRKTDTDLEAEVFRQGVVDAAGDTGEVTFTIRLSTADANGEALAELGAFDGGGDLQARLTHSSITKTSDFEIEYRLTETAVNPYQ